jgi:adenylate cyclase
MDTRVYDTLIRSSPTRAPSDRIVIVDIDERSLSAIGQWPWRRDIIARLIDRLHAFGASTVAFDIVFAEADRSEGTRPDPDTVLAGSIRSGHVVLGYALTFDGATSAAGACPQHPLGLAMVQRGGQAPADPFFRATGSICSLPVLTQAAIGSGFLNAAPDPDGILRRVPLLMQFGDRAFPGLALAAVTAAAPSRNAALTLVNANFSWLTLTDASTNSLLDDRAGSTPPAAGGSIPLDGKSNLLLRYRGGRRTFPYVPAVAVLEDDAPPTAFKDRIVFVGTTALGRREVVTTPLDTLFTGVEVHATVADNLLRQDFIYRPEYAVPLEACIAIGFGLTAIALVQRFPAVWSLLGIVAVMVALWIGMFVLISTSGVLLSPLFPTLGGAGALIAMNVLQSTLERLRADRAGREKATAQRVMVQALLSLVEIKDAETGRHSRRTQQYARVLAQALSPHPEFRDYLTPERIELLSTLAPLHDIGKVGVPDRLLSKVGALTADERAEMRKHPTHGRDVIVKTQREVGARDDVTLGVAKDIVYTHHERWDGTGYPEGLRGAEIPIPGRVMALVDVYDAAHTRPLNDRPMMTHEEAVALIVKGRGTHFDPAVVDAFLKVSPVLESLSGSGDADSG